MSIWPIVNQLMLLPHIQVKACELNTESVPDRNGESFCTRQICHAEEKPQMRESTEGIFKLRLFQALQVGGRIRLVGSIHTLLQAFLKGSA